MKRAKMLTAMLAVTVLMSGCSKFSPKETSVSLGKEGEITAAIFDKLDQDYYKEDELKSAIEEAVAEFTADKGNDCVTVEKFETEDQNVTLFMKYADGNTYSEFNNVTFYTGDMSQAAGEGYDFDTTFQKVEKGKLTEEEISGDQVLTSGNHKVVILEEEMVVEVPGKIVFVSSNVEVTGKKSAKVMGEKMDKETEAEDELENESETQETVVLVKDLEEETMNAENSAVAYIIYE